jgi:hypothetical protein
MPTWNGKTNYIIGADLSSSASFSLGTLPTDGEIVILDGDRFSSAVTTTFGYNLDLYAFKIHSNRTTNAGSLGSPLIFCADIIHVFAGSGASFYYKASGPDVYYNTDFILVDSDNLTSAVFIDSNANQNNVARVLVRKGGTTIAATCGDIDYLQAIYRNSPTTDAQITVSSGSSYSIGQLDIAGGVVTNNRAVTLATQSAGLFEQDNNEVDNLKITGGECVYNHTNIPEAHIHAGVLNLNDNTAYKTGNVYQYRKGVLRHTPAIHDLEIFDMGDTSRV